MKKRSKVEILEVTLRDGSYAVDFKFTARDTAIICAELERAGFRLIEVGHGIGLGAFRQPKWQSMENDEGYLKAAASTLKLARWGMFCIPGVARLEDIDLAASYGMNFIRVGTNVTQIEESRPFIERAKHHQMYVSANFMKSYCISPKEFAEKAKLTRGFGSDLLCIVDSAGGMLTDRLEEYFLQTKEKCDIPLGFHGHNNMNLAIANSLRAVELGATVIDTSLQGLGRSAGNASTEVFLCILRRAGWDLGIDPLRVMDMGEKYIKPLMQSRYGVCSLDVIMGYAEFHSSYTEIVNEFSSKYGIDPRKLILKLCEVNKVEAPRELVEKLAKEISQEKDEVFTARFRLHQYRGGEQT